MSSQLDLPVVIWLLGWAVCDGVVEQPEGATGGGQAPPAPEPRLSDERTVEQAIHDAMEALDRLESPGWDGPKQTALTEITDHIEFVRRNDPGNAMLPYLYGRAYAVVGRQGEAVKELQQFVETREGRHEWHAFRLLGDLFVEQYPQLAQAHYQSANALQANEPDVLLGLARCAAGRGRRAEAIRLARDAVRADHASCPAGIRHRAFLAKMLSADRQWDEAERVGRAALIMAEEAIRNRPGLRKPVEVLEAQYQLLIGILQARVAGGEGRVDDYLRFAEYVRARADITATLALYDVLAVIEAAVDRTSPNVPPRLMEQHGIVLAQIGRYEHARAVFQELLEVDPDNRVAPTWLKRIQDERGRSED